jgi:DNA-binding transcriptional ArsR family regulator
MAVVLTIDDFDALVFKREGLSTAIGEALAVHPSIKLLGACHPSACDRFLSASHPFNVSARARVSAIAIPSMDSEAAMKLIRRRVPRLSVAGARRVIREAGGHPAALVFLARLAELGRPRDATDLSRMLRNASEFAGTVYSESWASLGPQQRAILWELSARSTASAADIARAICLPSSHVSAQITRLLAEGLVHRDLRRGHFGVAPLLAGWIARRAVRRESSDFGGRQTVVARARVGTELTLDRRRTNAGRRSRMVAQ